MLDDGNGAASDGRVRRRRLAGDEVLPSAFYARPAEQVARDMLGRWLERDLDGVRCLAEIVETEAYFGPDDEASHAAKRFGQTARNAVMFGPAGIAYVYLIYGVHWCLNAVTDTPGHPAAVLIRAARPLEGLPAMRERRPGRSDVQLLRGPGNLCRSLAIDRALNGHDLYTMPLRLLAGAPAAESSIARGPRIGITRAVEHPLRFWIRDDPAVSGHR